MSADGPRTQIGPGLREWRERRRLTQMDLALGAGISTRHLSFLETGRSRPGRELLLRVLGHLEVPYRERNQLLLIAGHAPVIPERPLDHPDLTPAREAIRLILSRHEPNPAMVVDRAWNIVATNRGVARLARGIEMPAHLLGPPVNAVRASLHPEGLASRIDDVGTWRAFFRERLERQLALTADEEVAALLEELAGYPESEETYAPPPSPGALPGPLRMRGPAGEELIFISMFAGFDTPFEVTTSELAIELLFPADRTTATAVEALAVDR